jgi:hypothetical protein
MTVAGTSALQKLDELRNAWKPGSLYPFLIGTDEELKELQDSLEVPADDGQEILALAASFDVLSWLTEKGPTGGKSWPKKEVPKQTTLVSLYDVLSNQVKTEVHIGLVAVQAPYEVFAKLGYGGWNDCPEPHIHVALHRFWADRFKATPVALSNDITESFVFAPPTERSAALELARQQYTYCYDIVDQGVGSIGQLGSSLLNSHFWYFWWD